MFREILLVIAGVGVVMLLLTEYMSHSSHDDALPCRPTTFSNAQWNAIGIFPPEPEPEIESCDDEECLISEIGANHVDELGSRR